MDIKNPATGEIISTVQETDPDALPVTFERVKRAQRHWSQVPLNERIDLIATFADCLERQIDECARTQTLETGKPISQARSEVAATVNRVRTLNEIAASVFAGKPARDIDCGAVDERLSWEPLGVVANISAWNYPWFVSTNVCVPALLCGNGVLFKPSEYATLSGLKMAELLSEAGLPDDVFTPVIGGGDIGARVVDLPVNGVFFTGSVRTGKIIHQSLAGRFCRVGLELGGKDSCYVSDDVDIKTVAESVASGCFYNAGQSCCAIERLYVHEMIYGPFLDALTEAAKAYCLGDPLNASTQLGPLTLPSQPSVVKRHIQDAIDRGASIHWQGDAAKWAHSFFPATVLVNVDHSMLIQQDESFGPIIGVQKVTDDAEATSLMNDTEYGLTASVYCRDQERAKRILTCVDVGTAYINCCDRVSPMLPWSGRKLSGLGSTLGEQGLVAFAQPKAWHIKKHV